MPLTLRFNETSSLPIESESLRPDRLAGLSEAEVASRPARIGREAVTLGDLFRIERKGNDDRLVLEGDLSHARGIGAGMASGRMTVVGGGGPHLGAGMSGGEIEVNGDAGPWAGAEMRGGLIQIKGDAGDLLGAAYPGSVRGMRDGMILVEGSVGRDVGLALRRGVIAVGGASGEGLGRGMIAGSVFAFGAVGPLAGSGMKRGTLACVDPGSSYLPSPTFAGAGRHRFPFVTLFLRAIRDRGFPVPDGLEGREWERYNGDLLEGGRGELLILPPA